MNKTDNVRPVSSIKYDDKRAAIPDSAHQGEEQMAISRLGEKVTMRFGMIEEYRNDRKRTQNSAKSHFLHISQSFDNILAT
jgi:hypothetical protein